MPRGPLDLSIPSTGAFTLTTDFCTLFLLEQPKPWLATAAWIRVYEALGTPASTARSTLHRFDKTGFLTREAKDGVPGYAVSDAWLEIIRRDPGQGELEWLLVVFSVPESRRDVRHQLRSLLAKLGYASLGGGSWLGRGNVHELQEVLRSTGLMEFSHVFVTHPVEPERLLRSDPPLWDLGRARQAYESVITVAQTALGQRPAPAKQAFVEVVTVSNAWRLADAHDAHLPSHLLPDDWPREPARAAAEEVLEQKMTPAREWFQGAAES